jgi:pyruvate dehydrogenase E2 component (dihydrolipoamide acetyltransferase)
MPFTITMPKLTPTMEEGTIAVWHKKEGDAVKSDELLMEVATDKATVEYNALDAGFLRKILVPEGDSASVNQPVAIFTTKKDESIEGYAPEGDAPAEEPEEEDVAPTEKIVAKPAASKSGLAQPAFVPEPPLEDYEFEWPTGTPERIFASPLAKRLAQEKNIDLSAIKGTGPGGRIMKRDLDLAIPGTTFVSFGGSGAPSAAPGSFVEEAMTPMRKAIGERLQASKTFIPHFYVQQEVNAGSLVDAREQLKKFNIKVTYNDFIVRACALALKQHPTINSGFNSADGKIIRFQTIDICIAVSIEGGLLTPIVRHADLKNLGQISGEVKSLAKRAHQGKLAAEEYKGGSFTISNLGMFGISDFQAVINPPQAAILAVGGMKDRPIVEDGEIVPGKVMVLSLSSDHRVVDGADAAQFLNTVRDLLENPSTLLM